MEEKRLEQILGWLEESPGMPLLMPRDQEAVEAIGQVRRRHPDAHLVVVRGMRYITVTDAAVDVVLERLERERRGFARTVADYDREIADIRALKGGRGKTYRSPACTGLW